MRLYDLVLVLKPNLTEAKRKQVVESVKDFLKGSKITKETNWGQKVLAYPIKKEDAGFYVMLSVESETGVTKGFESRFGQNEAILRHLLIRNK